MVGKEQGFIKHCFKKRNYSLLQCIRNLAERLSNVDTKLTGHRSIAPDGIIDTIKTRIMLITYHKPAFRCIIGHEYYTDRFFKRIQHVYIYSSEIGFQYNRRSY